MPRVTIYRSGTPTIRPSGKVYGEPYVNFADNQFGVIDSSNNPRDLLGVPIFSPGKSYAIGNPVNYLGKLYVALVAVAPGAFNAVQWGTGLLLSGGQTITGGFAFQAYNQAAGNFTVNPMNGNYQYTTNNAAFAITAPTVDCAVDILITNGAAAGAITFTGFTVGANIGDALTTVSASKFIVSVRRINGTATYVIKALQ